MFRLRAIGLLAIVLTMLGERSARALILATWDGGSANWTDAAHWSTNPTFPDNNGANLYDAAIPAGAVALNQSITVNHLVLSGSGAIEGAFGVTALEGLQWSGGAIRGSGTLTLGPNGMTTISAGSAPLPLSGRSIINNGVATFDSGTIRGGSGASISNAVGASFTMLASANFFADVASPLYTISNAGTFTARSTSGFGFSTIDAAFTNTGMLKVENLGTSHTLSLAGGGTIGGTVDLQTGASIELGNGITLPGAASFTGGGTAVVAGAVLVSGSVSAQNLAVAVGELNIGANSFTVNGAAAQSGGAIRLNNGGVLHVNNNGSLRMDDGTLTGSGTLDAALDSQGIIAPGSPLGTLAITRATTLGTDAHLQIQLGGTTAGTFDSLPVADTAALGGMLDVVLFNNFTPAPDATFTILTASSISGFFANASVDGQRFQAADGSGSFLIKYSSNSVVLSGFVPEPSAISLIFIGALGAAAVRRRHRVGS